MNTIMLFPVALHASAFSAN